MSDRHQFRADWHDYNGGIYFVTICCAGKRHYFGEITFDAAVGTRFITSALGQIVDRDIQKIPSYYDDLEIWNYVVMPNHIHLVVAIKPMDVPLITPSNNMGCLKQRQHDTPESQDFHHNSRLASAIGAFKAGVTRLARRLKIAPPQAQAKIWQSRFHEHIILDQRSFDNIMNYIDNNVANWYADRYNVGCPVGTRFIASAPNVSTNANENKCINDAEAMNRVPTP